ncbi:MAG: cobalamin B12-binding domain-containing protein [Tissierellia bacterium]|nr:cobalamin B12-binding domain-containing protein [Tissierellia bacterium]
MKKIIACTIGNCVHVAGIMNFFNLADKEGYETKFLGIGLSIDEVFEAIEREKPDYVGLSYRLTPEPLYALMDELKAKRDVIDTGDIHWIFAGIEDDAKIAEEYGLFDSIFYGWEDIDETLAFLKGREEGMEISYPDHLIDRIEEKYPYPILRHHIGLPKLDATIEAIEKIAEEKVLDVISIAPDQNAQEFFFEQDKMDPRLTGAGGVPLRSPEDFRALYNAAQRGNFPLLRSYSGTKDTIPFAEVLNDTIKNAWCATPIFWYSRLDMRSKRPLARAIRENQELMRWHAQRNIPVEANDPHHWSLRDASDAIAVADAWLVAYNAKKCGVKHYIAQFMFNNPAHLSPEMDLGKMLAKIELIESLEDENFKVYREARAGLTSFPADLYAAKGQLAASAYLALNIKPHIYHVVGFCEAHHAADAQDVIESCKIVRGIIKNDFLGAVDMRKDINVQRRKEELIREAKDILEGIRILGKDCEDPFSDPDNLARTVYTGIFDAPQLVGNPDARGELKTRMVAGGLYAYDEEEGRIIPEKERVSKILEREGIQEKIR